MKLSPSTLTDLPVFSILSLNATCSGRGPRFSEHAIALIFSIASPNVLMFLGQTAKHFPQLVQLYNPSSKLSFKRLKSSRGSDSNLDIYLIIYGPPNSAVAKLTTGHDERQE